MLRLLRTPSLVGYRFSSSVPKCETVQVEELPNGVFNVQLNRPESRNAFTLAVWRDVRTVFDHLSQHSKCRAIVLSAKGKSFCAGIDLKDGFTMLTSVISDESKDVARKGRLVGNVIRECQESYSSLEKCAKPVIAAIHGHCIGAGISLVGSADIRYAVNDAVFSIREVEVGLAADVGILQRIQRIVGNDSWTREIAFTARLFTASEAQQYGFVSRTFDSQDACVKAAIDLATEIASKSPVAVEGTKKALNYAKNHSVEDSLEWMVTWNQSQLQTEDLMRNAMARSSKKKPEFNDI